MSTLSSDLTRYAMTLGAQDATTGWYAVSYASSTVSGSIQRKGSVFKYGSFGTYAKHDYTGFIIDGVNVGDKIKDAFDRTFYVRSVLEETLLDSHVCWVCDLELIDTVDRPTTSGTWHQNSQSVTDDIRYRHRVYLNTYLNGANLLKDNGVTGCSYITCFANADYPVTKVLSTTGKNVDLVFAIDKTDAVPTEDCTFYVYKFLETAFIHISTVNKSGITASNLLDQADKEVRRILSANPLGSIRRISSIKHDPVEIDGLQLHECTITFEYERWNDDFAGATGTTTFGNGFVDDCTFSTLGSWVETDAGNKCTLTCSQDDLFLLTATAGIASAYYSYPDEGGATNLGLGTATYKYTRIRWATSNTTVKFTATLVFSDASTQVLINAQSTTDADKLTVTKITNTATKTIDHIRLGASGGAGIIYVDFPQIYKDDFTFRNIVSIEETFLRRDAFIDIPGMGGTASQGLGSQSAEFSVTLDLTVDNPTNDWKRPQGNATKTGQDVADGEVFHEIVHDSWSGNAVWQWVTLPGHGAFKAIVDIQKEVHNSKEHTIALNVKEYRRGSANGELEAQRFGRS